MKFKLCCISLFLGLLTFSQNNIEWDELLDSAHNIGYCLYNVNQQFCNRHIEEYDSLVKETEGVEPEVHHFVMREKWAKNRVTNWANTVTSWEDRTKLNVNDLILFFRIPQDSIAEIPIATVETASSFFVVSLEDDLKFSVVKRYKNIAINCSIFHNEKPNMLWNIFWREFMSGRYGLLKNKVEFTISSSSKIRKKIRIFKRRFNRFKKQNFNLK